jgi:uncharacterized protein (TIGR03435 family)
MERRVRSIVNSDQMCRMKCCIAVLLLGFALVAQTPDSKLVFEVASVRPGSPNPDYPPGIFSTKGGPGTPDPGQINYTGVPMRELLRQAYGFNQMYQLSAPAWMENTTFDIVAKVPAGATRDEFNVMLQNLLAERFDLVAHHETRELPGYEMVIAKGGPKIKESSDAAAEPPTRSPTGEPPRLKMEKDRDGLPQLAPGSNTMAMFPIPNGNRYSARQQPLSALARLLTNPLGKPVVDKTGLTGKYDFNLTFVRDERTSANMVRNPGPSTAATNPADAVNNGPPDLFTAMQEQLGLRLDQKKIPVDVLVVDRAEKTPKEN